MVVFLSIASVDLSSVAGRIHVFVLVILSTAVSVYLGPKSIIAKGLQKLEAARRVYISARFITFCLQCRRFIHSLPCPCDLGAGEGCIFNRPILLSLSLESIRLYSCGIILGPTSRSP